MKKRGSLAHAPGAGAVGDAEHKRIGVRGRCRYLASDVDTPTWSFDALMFTWTQTPIANTIIRIAATSTVTPHGALLSLSFMSFALLCKQIDGTILPVAGNCRGNGNRYPEQLQ
jgi:hypothetical protein